jgi:ABC-type transport system involved in multi-copper enzyme maturation permease subunit
MRLWFESWAWAQISVRAVTRRPALLAVVGLAILASGSGLFFEAFSFGASKVEFLRSVNWAVQVIGLITVTLAIALQIHVAHENSGCVAVALARGICPASILLGQFIATAGGAAVFALGSSVVAAGAAGGLAGIGSVHVFISSLILSVTGGLIALVVLWLATWGREIGFVLAATAGVLVIGFLRPLAVDVGGAAAWFAMLAPDFSRLTEMGWAGGNLGLIEAIRAVAGALVYALALGWLAVRGMGRREH